MSNNMMIATGGPATEFNAATLLDTAMDAGFGKLQGVEDTAPEVLGAWLNKNGAEVFKDKQFSHKELEQLVSFIENRLSSNKGLGVNAKGQLQKLLVDLKETSAQWKSDLSRVSKSFSKDAVNLEHGAAVIKSLAPHDKSHKLNQGLKNSEGAIYEASVRTDKLIYIETQTSPSFTSPDDLRQVVKELDFLDIQTSEKAGISLELHILRTGVEQALKKYDAEVVKINGNVTFTDAQKVQGVATAERALRADISTVNLLAQTGFSSSISSSNTASLMQSAFDHNTLTGKMLDGSWRPADFASPKSYTVEGMQKALDALVSQHDLVLRLGDQLAVNHLQNKIRLVEAELNQIQSGNIVAGDKDIAFLRFSKSVTLLDFTTLTGMQEMLKLKKSQMPESPPHGLQKQEHEKKIQEIDKQMADVKVDRDTADKIMASLQDAIQKMADGKSEAYTRGFN